MHTILLNFRSLCLRKNRYYRALKYILNKTQHRVFCRNWQKDDNNYLKRPCQGIYVCAQQKKCETALKVTYQQKTITSDK